MMNKIKRIVNNQSGQGMAEYGLILALIAVVVIAVVTGIGQRLIVKFTEVLNALS